MLTLIPITYNPFKSFGMLSSIKSAKVAVHPILPIYRGISNFRLANTMAKKKLGMTRVPYAVGTLVYGMESNKKLCLYS